MMQPQRQLLWHNKNASGSIIFLNTEPLLHPPALPLCTASNRRSRCGAGHPALTRSAACNAGASQRIVAKTYPRSPVASGTTAGPSASQQPSPEKREQQSQATSQPPARRLPEQPAPLPLHQPLQQQLRPSNPEAGAPTNAPVGPTAATPAAAAPPTTTRRGVAIAFAASAAAVTAAAAATAIAGPASAAVVPSGGSSSNSSSSSGGSRFSALATSPAGQQQQQQDGAGGGEAGKTVRPVRRSWPVVPQVSLAAGLRVSKVIRGCWQLSGRHRGDPLTDRTSGGDAVADLAAFHRAGVTTLDVADNYGPAELLVGQYMRLYPGDSRTTTIATKLSYLTEEDMAGVSRTMVEYAVRSSLVRLGRQRLDLVQLQWAEPVRHRQWLDVLKWLADLREEGLINHLGVCNFAVPQLATAVAAGVPLVSNQVQFSLIDRRPQLFMQKAAASYGIKLLAYGTVAGGLLADRYYDVPAGKVRLDTASKQKYGLVIRQSGEMPGGAAGAGWAWMQEVLQATRTVAQRHGVSSSAVATAWVLHQPQVAAAIVGARNTLHIRDMQAACALELDDGDLLDLDAVWEGVPSPPTSDVYAWERGGPW